MENKKKSIRLEKLKLFWDQYKKDKLGVIGFFIVLAFILIGIFAPFIAPYHPMRFVDKEFLPPSQIHFMGTDHLGRDIFSGVIWGTRISLMFGLVSSLISLILGIILGLLSGYFTGIIEDLLSRLFEIFIMIPRLFLIIFVVSIFGHNIYLEMLVVGCTIWTTNAKIMRSQVLAIKNKTFIEASKGLGASTIRMLTKHILPNTLYPVIANMSLEMAGAILYEASLSYLGLGDPNHQSWGLMLNRAQNYFRLAWWQPFFPGLMILILCLSFNLVGDGINHVLNPRLKKYL